MEGGSKMVVPRSWVRANWKRCCPVDVKFQLCEISSTDLLYSIMFLVNNTVLCTQTAKRVDLLLGVLTTIFFKKE